MRGQPGIRAREPYTLPDAGPEAQMAGERRRLQDRSPTLPNLGAERCRPGQPPNLPHQLFARHHAAFQRACDGFRQAVKLLERDPEMLLPHGFPQISPARAENGKPQGQLAGRQQVQRAPHSPGLNQCAVVPQRPLNRFPVEAFHPRPHRQFGGGHQLGVQAAQAACHREHAPGGRASIEVLPLDTPCRSLRPGELQRWPARIHEKHRQPGTRPPPGNF